jgi:hypothetical protein
MAFWESSGAFVLYGAAIGGATSYLVVRVQARSSVELAREQRLFEKRAAAYVEVEEYLWKTLGEAQMTLRVLLQAAPALRDAGEPWGGSADRWQAMMAAARIWGSPEVRGHIDRCNSTVLEWTQALNSIAIPGVVAPVMNDTEHDRVQAAFAKLEKSVLGAEAAMKDELTES